MIKLSKRLEAIASLVPNNSKVIDIGCDHGLVDIYLYQKGISRKIIASDINSNALNNARENIKKNKLDGVIDVRLGAGMDTLNEDDDIDTIIISGMGAHTIVGILKNNLKKLTKIKKIIIQSNTKVEFIRREVSKLNYCIDDEIIVEDNKKFYMIVRFVKGKKRYTKKELYFGPILLKKNTKLFKSYNKQELKKLSILLKLLPKNKIIERYKIRKQIKLYRKIELDNIN